MFTGVWTDIWGLHAAIIVYEKCLEQWLGKEETGEMMNLFGLVRWDYAVQIARFFDHDKYPKEDNWQYRYLSISAYIDKNTGVDDSFQIKLVILFEKKIDARFWINTSFRS